MTAATPPPPYPDGLYTAQENTLPALTYLVDRSVATAYYLDLDDCLLIAPVNAAGRVQWAEAGPAFDPRMDDDNRRLCDRAYRALVHYRTQRALAASYVPGVIG